VYNVLNITGSCEGGPTVRDSVDLIREWPAESEMGYNTGNLLIRRARRNDTRYYTVSGHRTKLRTEKTSNLKWHMQQNRGTRRVNYEEYVDVTDATNSRPTAKAERSFTRHRALH